MTAANECRDLLVNLRDIPDIGELEQRLHSRGVVIRTAMAPEKHIILGWVKEHFWPAWVSECEMAFGGHPVRCLIATAHGRMAGFCTYDSIALGVCGPIGVDDKLRGAGVGQALFVRTLLAMRSQGYAYAVIGWVGEGPAAFVRKTLPVQIIDDSAPDAGLYNGLLRDAHQK